MAPVAPAKSRLPSDLRALARVWQDRLGLGDWPAVYRVQPVERPRVLPGPVDVVILPEGSSEPDVILAVLLYAAHNVPADRMPAVHDLKRAASELAVCWPNI